MSKISLIFLCGLLGFCPCVSAYSNLSSQQRPTNEIVDDWVIKWEKQLVDAADAMPADKYSFAPTNGEFHGVRTFAEQVKHIAAANFILAASVLGEKPPEDAGDETGPSSIYTKPDIIQYLKDSFVHLHKAATSIDEKNEVIPASPISPLQNNGTRLGLVIEAIFHSADHYGQMVEYLRMNGIVPPASR